MGQLKFFKRNAAKDVFLIIFQKFHNSSFSNFPEKCIKRFYIECLVNQMTLLQTFSRQISHYCRTIKRKQKCFKENYRVNRGNELFLKTKKVLIKICNISHLTSCKLPRKLISWVSRNTKISNCIVFFTVPITVETAMEALPQLVIYLFN